jgi:queuine tRNA-ribosyltransferase
MGVGTPENILEAAARGVDFFDCVMPARNGRHGHVYTSHGKINLLNARFERDEEPIDRLCGCSVCSRHSKAYIRHLFKAGEMLAKRLCVMHNLYFYNNLMTGIRDALDEGRFEAFKRKKLNDWKGL